MLMRVGRVSAFRSSSLKLVQISSVGVIGSSWCEWVELVVIGSSSCEMN